MIRRALLSCHDKSGLDGFAKELVSLGVELVASGGTAEFLKSYALPVVSVEQFAGIKEQLDGRVKTLHPKIHAGILARRDDTQHVKSVGQDGLIDLVVVNLYPFEATIKQTGVSLAEAIEQIDIGGVALLRAAAKNFSGVAVISKPDQYTEVAAALKANRELSAVLRQRLAVEAFALTSGYDSLIAGFLSGQVAVAGDPFADTVSRTLHKRQVLRYGENPHQPGAWYVPGGAAWGLGTLTQLQGKELSYNNLMDMDAAIRCVADFEEPACVIIKHNSQCGLASGADSSEAYERAYACDAESAFGGIVGFNRPIDAKAAEKLTATFLEVILAPQITQEALAIFKKKQNLRVASITWPIQAPAELQWRQLLGSWILQASDSAAEPPKNFRLATKRPPSTQEMEDLLFAWKAAKHVKSNGVVLAKNKTTVGIGQGQPSRVGSVKLAIEKAGSGSHHCVAASDGFFPFADSINWLAKAGVTAIIQPGGSIRDAEVIAAADAAGLAMLITGIRHFRH